MSDLMFSIKFLFSSAWAFFTEINVPGTEFSFASLFIGLFLISLSLRILSWALSARIKSDDVGGV